LLKKISIALTTENTKFLQSLVDVPDVSKIEVLLYVTNNFVTYTLPMIAKKQSMPKYQKTDINVFGSIASDLAFLLRDMFVYFNELLKQGYSEFVNDVVTSLYTKFKLTDLSLTETKHNVEYLRENYKKNLMNQFSEDDETRSLQKKLKKLKIFGLDITITEDEVVNMENIDVPETQHCINIDDDIPQDVNGYDHDAAEFT
jgi:hypothetical protein